MSYCRFISKCEDGSLSDVWCYTTADTVWVVKLAEGAPRLDWTFDSAAETADWLDLLKADGIHVPQYAIDRLREEAD